MEEEEEEEEEEEDCTTEEDEGPDEEDIEENQNVSTKKRLDQQRLLTEEDFRKIKALRKLKEEGKLDLKQMKVAKMEEKSRKVKPVNIMGYTLIREDEDEENVSDQSDDSLGIDLDISDEENEEYDPSVVIPESLEGIKKKKRRELQEKLQDIKAENEARKEKKRSRIVNNTEKAKRTKDYQMVQHSHEVRKKQKLSLRDQQATVRRHMKNIQKKNKLLTKVRKRG